MTDLCHAVLKRVRLLRDTKDIVPMKLLRGENTSHPKKYEDNKSRQREDQAQAERMWGGIHRHCEDTR